MNNKDFKNIVDWFEDKAAELNDYKTGQNPEAEKYFDQQKSFLKILKNEFIRDFRDLSND